MKCKNCGVTTHRLNKQGYCFWCWEEVQEGLEMLKF